MKIPKYIERALDRRANAALDLMAADRIISDFIEEYHIEVEEADYLTGYEIYANPISSAYRVREAILNHNEN